MTSSHRTRFVAVLACSSWLLAATSHGQDKLAQGLIGYWPLRGDCQDHSGRGNHGTNHGVELADGKFDGRTAYINVPSSDSLRLGTNDFTISAWVHTVEQLDDAIGDVLDLYDPAARRGITLSINSSASGYMSQTNDRHVYFGIDNAKFGEWQDCGRPNATSPYVNNSMIVFRGRLYAATIEGHAESDWRHVYRYDGDQKWTDCGQLGTERATGVGPLFVHNGELYAVTTTYDWTRVQQEPFEGGHLYRYAGGTTWIDCGAPNPENRTLNCASSFQGKLYVGGGPQVWGVSVRHDDGSWHESIRFEKRGARRCFPHPMTRYNGRLYTGWPSVYSFDGHEWKYAGVPIEPESQLQTHSFAVFRGDLVAGTWPQAKVARYRGDEQWEDIGRAGKDGTEVNSLLVYNGKLYGGSLPRAEVCRYDESPQWTSLRRFYSPADWTPVPPRENGGSPTREQVAQWSRVTSMTIHRGRLFAGIGNCTSSKRDFHTAIHGSVHSVEAGKCVSYDDELAPGWRHLTAIRERDRLKLYVDGRLVAESTPFRTADYDLSTQRPLRIGLGQTDYFNGRIRELRMYNRALAVDEIKSLASAAPSG